MSNININTKVQPFSAVCLNSQKEQQFTNDNLLGLWSVIYFYPKDMTPGCTLEACEFRDNYQYFIDNKVNVYAVSADSIDSHSKFAQKHNLPFILVSDSTYSMSKAFDVYNQKSMFGKKYIGIDRTTFLINPDGIIIFKWEKVKPIGHSLEVKKKLQEFL